MPTALALGEHESSGSLPLNTSSPSVKPSSSVSGFVLSVPANSSPALSRLSASQSAVLTALISGSHGSTGLVPKDTSSPSLRLSPSVSGLFGSVPARFSSSLVNPSRSQSSVPSPEFTGSHALRGSVPFNTSFPSLKPSLSVSGLVLSVPASSSPALSKLSLSQSDVLTALISGSQASIGLVPAETSSPSFEESPSVSGLLGSVPAAISSSFVSPSRSQSSVPMPELTGSQAFKGSVPFVTSFPSESPSLSVSGLVLSVPASSSPALSRPSLSQSFVEMAPAFGSHESSGLLAPSISTPSRMPSPSVSLLSGSVP